MARILVVDDDIDACEIAAARLAQSGHNVECQINGRDAILQLMEQMPDIVVLDLLMPEMDGTSLLDVVRSYLRLQTVPVVVWTALPADNPQVERALRRHVDAVVVKGISTLDNLAAAVDWVLDRISSSAESRN
jgi:CheY-like chemotaxis protein